MAFFRSSSRASVMITGATSGIGKATALKYAAESPGTKLILTGRRQALLDEVVAEISALGNGSKALPLCVDGTDREGMFAAVKALPEEFASVRVLVNNAGAAIGVAPLAEGSVDDWEAMIDINCKGLLYATKAVLPGMIERKKGYVVNIGSVAGSYALPGGNVYCATKAFVNHLSLAMRAELIGKGVRVSSIEPGNTETEFSVVRFKGDEAKAKAVYEAQTGPRVACTGGDIADIIYFATETLPEHVNINHLEVMPERQGFGPFQFNRE
mmetsp:Transcript_62141/g.122057  ORF Transcript_62141/g.122057 Transcript_62141/m.122057 type:complete len:269 (-) Transcript_62141:202-1008(-)